MGVTATKVKVKVKAAKAKTELTETLEAYVSDRLELEAGLAKLGALKKAVETNEKLLLSSVDEDLDVPADKPIDFVVGDYVVRVGAHGRQAISFDKALIKTELGSKVFNEIAMFKIEDLKKYLTGEVFEQAVEYAATKKRQVVIEAVEPT